MHGSCFCPIRCSAWDSANLPGAHLNCPPACRIPFLRGSTATAITCSCNCSPRRASPACYVSQFLWSSGFHSMVEFPLWHANFLGAFALLFGLASPASVSVEPTRLRRGLVLVVVLAG